jgi:thiol-disulfide isomerase/thioredoxin
LTPVWIFAFALLASVVVVLALVVVGTLRRIAIVLEEAESRLSSAQALDLQPEGLSVGAEIGPFEGRRADGGRFADSDLVGTESIVLFLSSDCPPCRTLANDLGEPEAASELGVRVVAVLDETDRDGRIAQRVQRGATVVYQSERSVARAFGSNATPHAFLVDGDGVVVARGTPNTIDGLVELAEAVRAGVEGRHLPYHGGNDRKEVNPQEPLLSGSKD